MTFFCLLLRWNRELHEEEEEEEEEEDKIKKRSPDSEIQLPIDEEGRPKKKKYSISHSILLIWFRNFQQQQKKSGLRGSRTPPLIGPSPDVGQSEGTFCVSFSFLFIFFKFIQSPYWIKTIPYLRSDFGNVHKEKPGKNPVKLARARHLRTTRERIRTAFVFFCLFFCRSGHHHPLLLISSSFFFFPPGGPPKKKKKEKAQKDEENEEQKKTKREKEQKKKKEEAEEEKKNLTRYTIFFSTYLLRFIAEEDPPNCRQKKIK